VLDAVIRRRDLPATTGPASLTGVIMAVESTGAPGARVPLDVAVRSDDWWVKPTMTVIGLVLFGIYTTWRAFEGANYKAEPYISPFYSPEVPLHLALGGWVISPAFYILVFPLAFRATCYYYRQAYYRAFFRDPHGCAVPEPKGRKYQGERAFPFVLQNLHRYALYAAIIVTLFLWYDTVIAFFHDGRFMIGLGSLIMLANVVLLSGYTFGCHALRHLVGGRMDCFTCPMATTERKPEGGYFRWRLVTLLNRNHMQWAWASLVSVGLTDLYIRLCATGAITDPRFYF
jgi:hypothetical protein